MGHIEVSMIWPYLSSCLSRIIVAPGRRGEGIGGAMVARAAAFSLQVYHVAHIDLGVAAENCPLRVFSDWGGRGQATFSLIGPVGRLWV